LTPINLAAVLAEAFCRLDLFAVHPRVQELSQNDVSSLRVAANRVDR
jgi:hypothetical protein